MSGKWGVLGGHVLQRERRRIMKDAPKPKSGNVVDFTHYRQTLVKSKKPPVKVNREAEYAAQELIYDAWKTANKKTRISLAKEALLLFPDCADAYNLLAEDVAKSLEESKEYYRLYSDYLSCLSGTVRRVNIPAWENVPGALAWLKKQTTAC